jgi:hypothetical protein
LNLREDIPTPEKYASILREDIPTPEKRDPVWREDIQTSENRVLDLRHIIPTWGWSAPDSGQVFQTLGRLPRILILCDIVAGTGLVDGVVLS